MELALHLEDEWHVDREEATRIAEACRQLFVRPPSVRANRYLRPSEMESPQVKEFYKALNLLLNDTKLQWLTLEGSDLLRTMQQQCDAWKEVALRTQITQDDPDERQAQKKSERRNALDRFAPYLELHHAMCRLGRSVLEQGGVGDGRTIEVTNYEHDRPELYRCLSVICGAEAAQKISPAFDVLCRRAAEHVRKHYPPMPVDLVLADEGSPQHERVSDASHQGILAEEKGRGH